jgi:hypothetical protein
MATETLFDQIKEHLENNPVVAYGMLGAAALAGLVAVLTNLEKLAKILGLRKGDLSGQQAALISLAEKNGTDDIAKMQRVIDAVNAKSKGHANKLEQQLQQFKELHQRYLEAVKNGDLVLQHQTNDQIHTVIEDFSREVEERHSEIIKGWYDALPRKFITAPLPGQDPHYDNVRQNALDLYRSTIDIAKSLDYPKND